MGETTDHRRVYAKGFFDGMEAAKRGDMNAQKFAQKWEGLTGIAKKVYEATPKQEAWTDTQIADELRRTSPTRVDLRILAGCLKSLVGSGLVREVERGKFQREPVREKAPMPVPTAQVIEIRGEQKPMYVPKPDAQPIPKPTPAEVSPVDLLGSILKRIEGVVGVLKEIGNDMADAALKIEAGIEKNNADTAKLRQLQELLKSIGG